MTPVERVEQELELELTFLALPSLCFVIVLPPFPPTLATPEERAVKGWSVPQDICAMMG